MGSELQGKYQKLAQEYAKLRGQVDVLKQAVKNEKKTNTALEADVRAKDQALRKHIQENESLSFRNQQLSKRVAMLQEDLDSSSKSKKKKDTLHVGGSSTDVQSEELAAKITENEQLHTKMFEISQKSQKTVSQYKEHVSKLEREVAENDKVIAELNKESARRYEELEQEKIMLKAKIEKLSDELQHCKATNLVSENTRQQGQDEIENKRGIRHGHVIDEGLMSLNLYCRNNESGNSLFGSTLAVIKSHIVEFLDYFTSFTSYLFQQCSIYSTVNTTSANLSPVDDKLSESSELLKSYANKLSSSIKQCSSLTEEAMLAGFSKQLKEICSWFKIFASYFTIRITSQSYGSLVLTQANSDICIVLEVTPSIIESLADYIALLASSQSDSAVIANVIFKLRWCSQAVHNNFIKMANNFNSKVSEEYQLSSTPQKLNTLNECIISSLTQLCTVSQKFIDFIDQNDNTLSQLFCRTEGENSNSAVTVALKSRLKTRASTYNTTLTTSAQTFDRTVPYLVAIHQSKDFTDVCDNYQALLEQVAVLQKQLAGVSEEKEQLAVELQLANARHSKKAAYDSSPQFIVKNGSDASITDSDPLLRQHFSARISQLNYELQQSHGKLIFLLSQCNTLTKQLNQSTAAKMNYSHELESARESIHQLQDQMMTLSSSYEGQLSAMSDHLCELRDKLAKNEEELEIAKRGKKRNIK